MLISINQYAKLHGKSGDTIRRFAEHGLLTTAHKIGRNWVVDSGEKYPVCKRTIGINKEKSISVVSLFAGCGGMDLGFIGGFDFLGKHYEKTGFKIIWANEINPAACKTYRRNFGNYIVEDDINNVFDELPTSADVIIGGFPCQDISINGKMLGIKGKRSSLYTAIVEAVRRIRPKAFVAENVGALLMKKHEESLNKILEDFRGLGYNVTYHLYQAEEYGVPQTRNRVFFVGTRDDIADFTPPIPNQKTPIPVKEAINDLADKEWDPASSHIWSKAKATKEQGNRKLVATRPGYTIRSECHGNIQFHYSKPRRISMREAARIQSFPDTFIFPCGLRETERQIGNAVPPVLAWTIAKKLKEVLFNATNAKTKIRKDA